jgi:hypothetical protein
MSDVLQVVQVVHANVPCLIGENMLLTARNGDDDALEDVTWVIGGRTIAAFDPDAGALTALDDLAVNPIEFHWVESGVFTATATAEDDQWSRTYAVSAPTAVTFTAVAGAVALDTTADPKIAFGNGGEDPAMRFTARVTGPADAGEIACIVIAKLKRIRTTAAGAKQAYSCNNVWKLDTGFDDPTDVAATTAVEKISDHNVSVALQRTVGDVDYTTYDVDDSFRAYLCFKSDRASSVWVALRQLGWRWTARATYAADVWTLVNGAAVAEAAADAASNPTWDGDASAVDWEDVTIDAATDNSNCYGYALGINSSLTPGMNYEATVNDIMTWSDDDGPAYAVGKRTELMDACVADGLARVAPGQRIGVYMHEYGEHIDFHFVREQVDGRWAHKPGVGAVEVNIADHATIEVADVTAYHFCGYLYVPPGFLWRMNDMTYAPRP